MLAETNAELVIDRSDRPFATIDDLVKLLPSWLRGYRTSISDAVLLAWGAMVLFAWARYGQASLALVSPRHAAGAWLDEWGRWYKRPRQPGETDGQYRARLLTPSQVVTPAAIRTAVDSIVAQYTVEKAAYLEPSDDAMFCKAANLGWQWSCFAQPSTQRLWGYDPLRVTNLKWGAYTTPAQSLPRLWIVLPGVGRSSGQSAFAAKNPGASNASFCSPASPVAPWAYVFSTGLSLIEKVFSEVMSRKASGVLVFVFHDPLIASAV